MDSKKYSRKMIQIHIGQCLVYGISNPFIHRAFQENMMVFWFTFEDFLIYVSTFVIMHFMTKKNCKKLVFDNYGKILSLAIVIDFISLIVFGIYKSYLQVLIVDSLVSTLYIMSNAVFMDIKASIISGSELSEFSKNKSKYTSGAQIISKTICMLIALIISKDLISFEFVFILEFILFIGNIIFQYLYYRLYKNSINLVYDMWNNEK